MKEKTSLIPHSDPAAPADLAVLALAFALLPAPVAAVWTTTTRTTRAGRNDLGIH